MNKLKVGVIVAADIPMFIGAMVMGAFRWFSN